MRGRWILGLLFALGMGWAASAPQGILAQPPETKPAKKAGKGESKADVRAAESRASRSRPMQKLWIPPLVEGKSFELTLEASTKSFWTRPTSTFGFNQTGFWGPTLVFRKGDLVEIQIRNELDEPTTLHWHGLHVPANVDGGPHQVIPPKAIWPPSFVVRNNAGTYWYHPHAHATTQKQLTMGAGGLIIVRDEVEEKLDLPRSYGVDDIPLAFTSRRFLDDDQFSLKGDDDKYGDFLLANGTLDAQASLPAQLVRLRILNAEIERGYLLGFSDNRIFHVIASDGGLLDEPVPVKRLPLHVGERVEILVNLGSDKVGSTLDLMAFNSGQKFGFPGSERDRGRPNGGLLNNTDFRLLQIAVAPPTARPVTRLPERLTRNLFPSEFEVKNRRTVRIARPRGSNAFEFDGQPFRMSWTNHIVKLDDVEAWTISNDRGFGHTFHIHGVQFKIISRSDGPVPDYEQGWKDTLFLAPNAFATFLARFENYASDIDPYMYHCHMSNHEDSGLMGQFVVVRDPKALKSSAGGMIRFRDFTDHPLTPEMIRAAERQARVAAAPFQGREVGGQPLSLKSLAEKKSVVLFFIDKDCPCSRDAAIFFNRIHSEYAAVSTVVGIINAPDEVGRQWAKQVEARFPIVADPQFRIIDAYAAERSVYTTFIAPPGTIEKTFPGYSVDTLRELSAMIARQGNVAEKPIDFSRAPKELWPGCPLKE